MIARMNRLAKAIVAFAIPTGVLAADLAGQWLDITADDTIVASEWQLFLLAIVTGVGVYFKRNAPPE